MHKPPLEKETLALLVQLLREQFGSQMEVVSTTVANRHEDYLVLLATLRHPSLEVVIKLAGPRLPIPILLSRLPCFIDWLLLIPLLSSRKYLQWTFPIESGPGAISSRLACLVRRGQWYNPR